MTRQRVLPGALISFCLLQLGVVQGAETQELFLPIVTTGTLSPTRYYDATIILQNITTTTLEVRLTGFSGAQFSSDQEQTLVTLQAGKLVRVPIHRTNMVHSGWVRVTYEGSSDSLQASLELCFMNGQTSPQVVSPDRIVGRAVLPAVRSGKELWTSARWEVHNLRHPTPRIHRSSAYAFVNPSATAVAHIEVAVDWHSRLGGHKLDVQLVRTLDVPPLERASFLFNSASSLNDLGAALLEQAILVPSNARWTSLTMGAAKAFWGWVVGWGRTI